MCCVVDSTLLTPSTTGTIGRVEGQERREEGGFLCRGLEFDFLSNRLWQAVQDLFVAQENRPDTRQLFLNPSKSFRIEPIYFRHLGEE